MLPPLVYEIIYPETQAPSPARKSIGYVGWDSLQTQPKLRNDYCDAFSSANAFQGENPRPIRDVAVARSYEGSPREPFTSIAMERTASGNSILSETTVSVFYMESDVLGDEEAARRVSEHVKRNRSRFSRKGRILYSIIHGCGPVDDIAIMGVLAAADEVFFNGALNGRVGWEWSHPGQGRYEREVVGTTALRQAVQGGYETLIVLSTPLLRGGRYNRRLLLSAFLHELVHCYLFICCGFEARRNDHTPGFHEITRVMDRWAGRGTLRLCQMTADLHLYPQDESGQTRMDEKACGKYTHRPSVWHTQNHHRVGWSNENWLVCSE